VEEDCFKQTYSKNNEWALENWNQVHEQPLPSQFSQWYKLYRLLTKTCLNNLSSWNVRKSNPQSTTQWQIHRRCDLLLSLPVNVNLANMWQKCTKYAPNLTFSAYNLHLSGEDIPDPPLVGTGIPPQHAPPLLSYVRHSACSPPVPI